MVGPHATQLALIVIAERFGDPCKVLRLCCALWHTSQGTGQDSRECCADCG